MLPHTPNALKILSLLEPVESKEPAFIERAVSALFPKTARQKKLFFKKGISSPRNPLRVGVVFSGGQASGGHNVIIGLYQGLKALNKESVLFGFLNGPSGIVEGEYFELKQDLLEQYLNTGGFDLIGSGRTKIETDTQLSAAAKHVTALKLDGLVIIGGDDSNTNAALLAEYFSQNKIETTVVGVPKTIDGDLKNKEVEISFGFDTACKTFAATIGNICRDALSAKKYYFFIKLMGRSASHIALECALQTHPNLTLIGEEVASKQETFQGLTEQICDMICKRAEKGKNYGVVLIPEGIIEFIPEFKMLIEELNRLKLSPETSLEERREGVQKELSSASLACFRSIPHTIQEQLLFDRDPHGNVQVSKIETERLFIAAVQEELQRRKELKHYQGTFNAQPLFLGYEGRSCYPSSFDASYCYALGQTAALLVDQKLTGYMSCLQHLQQPVEEWNVVAVPIVSMIHQEERKGKMKPVIKKALVALEGAPFQAFEQNRKEWIVQDAYCYPLPIQVEENTITYTLKLEQQNLSRV